VAEGAVEREQVGRVKAAAAAPCQRVVSMQNASRRRERARVARPAQRRVRMKAVSPYEVTGTMPSLR
jgi:hypothetical protein